MFGVAHLDSTSMQPLCIQGEVLVVRFLMVPCDLVLGCLSCMQVLKAVRLSGRGV